MTSRTEYQAVYQKAWRFCGELIADLPLHATLAIAAAHPELDEWLRQADAAERAGDFRAFHAAMRGWGRGWRAAVQAHQLAGAA